MTVGDELITVDHAYSHKKLRFVVHLYNCFGEPKPLPVSRCVGCGQMTWGITPFQPPMLGLSTLYYIIWVKIDHETFAYSSLWPDEDWLDFYPRYTAISSQ